MKTNKDNRAGRDNLSKLIQRFDGLENNNPPTNPIDQRKSGILYTSDWIDKQSYPGASTPLYEEYIIGIDKNQREGEWVYDIQLVFRNIPSPNYGENLINANDFFVIKKVLPAIPNPITDIYNNDVRGYVKNVSIKYNAVNMNNRFITYSLTCIITEGDPYLVNIGDRYVWSRDEFVDDESFTRIPPTNLESLKITNVDSLLTWTDSTDSANSFILRIRKNGSNLLSDIYYIDNIVLSPVINYRTGNRNATDGSVYEYTFDFSSLGLVPGEWKWSLCSVYDDLRKDFSMWSDESLLIIK